MLVRKMLVTALGVMAFASGANATTIFNLSGSVGDTPTFSITSGGLTATFTSPAGNGFQVQNTAGLLSFSPALLDDNFFGSDNLTITFSKAVTDTVMIPFAIEDAFGLGSDFLTVTANTGQSLIFGAIPDALPLGEPEGLAIFKPSAAITSLTLSSPIAFAVGNAQIPEPMTVTLLGVGLVGLVASRRRSGPASRPTTA